MKALENRAVDSKRETEILDALQDIRARNARNEQVGQLVDLLAHAQMAEVENEDDAERKRLEHEDEKLVEEVFSRVALPTNSPTGERISGTSVVTVKRKAEDTQPAMHHLLSELARALIASRSATLPAVAKRKKMEGKSSLGIKIVKKGKSYINTSQVAANTSQIAATAPQVADNVSPVIYHSPRWPGCSQCRLPGCNPPISVNVAHVLANASQVVHKAHPPSLAPIAAQPPSSSAPSLPPSSSAPSLPRPLPSIPSPSSSVSQHISSTPADKTRAVIPTATVPLSAQPKSLEATHWTRRARRNAGATSQSPFNDIDGVLGMGRLGRRLWRFREVMVLHRPI
jgi:hypothetical protein